MKIEFVDFDAKEISLRALRTLQKTLAEFGVYVYDDPRFEATDSYGLILANVPLSEKEIEWQVTE